MKVTRCLYCNSSQLEQVTYRSDHLNILECQHCKLMMVDTLNSPTETFYNIHYFEKEHKNGRGYDQYLSSPAANLIGKFAFAHLFANGKKHLDLGSADGSLMEIFEEHGYDTHGLEISEEAASIAHQKGLSVNVTDLHTFPKHTAGLGVITAYDLLEHTDRPGLVFKNIYNSLAEGGVFVFSTLCVRTKDPSDYWFNNSLEHYAYYTKESLTNILKDTFGKGRFGIVEEEVNGVAEIWGFAKKGDATSEIKIIDLVAQNDIQKDAPKAYYFSLFYNHVSKFDVSRKIIDSWGDKWGDLRRVEALFYHYYIQGKFSKALDETRSYQYLVPAHQGVFWQAFGHAERVVGELALESRRAEGDSEILALRQQVFNLRDELRSLTHSRVLGKIIKIREFIGDKLLPGARALPKQLVRLPIYYAKEAVIAVIPKSTTKRIVALKRSIRESRKIMKNDAHKSPFVDVQTEPIARNKPLLSVVIPYYNRANTIDQTLRSLEGQTLKNFEVIVIDDGSTDVVSKQVFSTLQERYTSLHIQTIRQENQGVAQARNNGIRAAAGRYIICLDSDDILTSTYIEKCVVALETSPDISLVTSYREHFGVVNEVYPVADYNPERLIEDNMVTTAAAFRKEAWVRAGGYKSGISYEDWEFWLTLAENGDWGITLQEPLFQYRVELQSRFQEDKDKHWDALQTVKKLHPDYKKTIAALMKQKRLQRQRAVPESAFSNLSRIEDYEVKDGKKPSVLIAIPWMTFGGAETLIYNFCRELKNSFNISFVTGLPSGNEWQYKFAEISELIYHLPRLFSDDRLYFEFISNYISTHHIDILHIIHSGFVFDMLPELKKRHPNLKVAVTMFNDRVEEYVQKSVQQQQYIDTFSTDSKSVAESFKGRFTIPVPIRVIPNGIDCSNEFNPRLFEREAVRASLGLEMDEKAVFFIGRLSEEKNPDVFVEIARRVVSQRTSGPAVKFFVIGDGPMKRHIEDMVHKSRTRAIQYLGYQAEIAKYLSAADIFVLPSSIEGFPLSILEAMSMGVAVIASRVGAVPDVIADGKNGYVITPGSVEEATTKVLELLDNTLLSNIRVQNRHDAETKYSNKQLGINYRKLYREVMR